MIKNNMTIKIGGEAGMGVESGGAGLNKAFSRGGLYTFAHPDYMSRIRGGHNFYQIRVSDREVFTFRDDVHLLVAFTQTCIQEHAPEIVKGGGIIFDEILGIDPKPYENRGIKMFSFPLSKMANEIGGHRIMVNTCALGATAGIIHYDFKYIEDIILWNFKKKGDAVVAKNIEVAKAGYKYAVDHYAAGYEYRVEAIGSKKRVLMHGNNAIALGAAAGGCKFMSAYPMTPATTIFESMVSLGKRYGIVTKQTEDEIAAVLFAIGANHAGVRAMVPTSGGGFDLMVEALGLASITETPLVIVEVQRGGPSTGLPTRTGQDDLYSVIHASHGEGPRIVLAPGNTEQCFEAGWRALNLAEKYQMPVIILSDMHLSNSMRTIDKERFDIKNVKIDRGALLTSADLDKLQGPYKRYALTDSGISPRAIPSHPKGVFATTSDEHTEDGFAVEDVETRNRMVEKRLNKIKSALAEMRAPLVYGDADADITLVVWGSTIGSAKETVDQLRKQGQKANLLQFVDLWPFPAEKTLPLLQKAKHLIAVEHNSFGQLTSLIRRETGVEIKTKVLKYSGRPISPDEILANLKEEALVNV